MAAGAPKGDDIGVGTMKICVAGANGRMGRRVLELVAGADDMEIAGGFDMPELAGTELTVGDESGCRQVVTLASDAAGGLAGADVLIDFTLAGACVGNVRAAAEAKIPSVVGTTGLDDAQQSELAKMAEGVPIVFAPNMSVGVNLLFKIAGEVASILGLDYNVEITEIHHNRKRDSPSGTAVRLAESVARALDLRYERDVVHGRAGLVGERPRNEIGMHALRGGDVVGEHTVCFVGQGERIELTHKAHSRDNFARGALVAARFVVKAAPGLYDMQQVLGLD